VKASGSVWYFVRNLRSISESVGSVLCPAWRRWCTTTTVKPGTVILHSEADDVIPIADSRELLRASELPESALIVVGTDHRLAPRAAEGDAGGLRGDDGVPVQTASL
jgi:hypothetical protein